MLDPKIFQTKGEELLGLRGSKPNHAVRFKDLPHVTAGFDTKAVRDIAEKVARDIAEGYDDANVDLSQLQQDIDNARQEASQAATDAQNALSAASNASNYTDQKVQEARDDLAQDYAAAQQAVEDAIGYATTAETHADNAYQSAQTAIARAQDALNYSQAATQARDGADQAKDAAEQAAAQSQSHASSASGSATAAQGSAVTASTKATEAEQSATAAAASVLSAQTQADNAEGHAQASLNAASAAAGYRDAAGNHAAHAEDERNLAASAANAAGQSASAASSSASAASSKADEAEQAASAAQSARTEAETARGQAQASAQSAATSESNAEGSANAASQSAGVAATARDGAVDAALGPDIAPSFTASPRDTVPAFGTATAGLPHEFNTNLSSTASYGSDADGRYIQIDATGGHRYVRTRALAAVTAESVVEVVFRVKTSVEMALAIRPYFIDHDGADIRNWQITFSEGSIPSGEVVDVRAVISQAADPLSTSTGGTVEEWDTIAGIRFGLKNNDAYADETVRIYSVVVRDLTAPSMAGKAATAAAGSAQSALASEQGAEAHASAAQQERTQAETARGQAETYRDQASSSATNASNAASAASQASGVAVDARNSAQGYASAASSSASTAGSHAGEAQTQANASQQSRLAAEAAAGEAAGHANTADQHRTQAGIARDAAVSARDAAGQSAASASDSMEMAAQIAGRGDSIIADQFFRSSDWTRWSSGGTLDRLANAIYPIGQSWRFTVTEAQEDGVRIFSSDEIWVGQVDAEAYVVEVEFTLNSGSLNGAGVRVGWRNSAGTTRYADRSLSSMVSGPAASGKTQIARAVFMRPSNFSGTFARHEVFAQVNRAIFAPMSAKTITIHRINVRVASEEEMGRGEVMAGVQAHLTQNYFTRAETNQAIANFDMSLNASLDTMRASVNSSSSAIAALDGTVARFRNVTSVNGEFQAGIEAFSFSGGPSGSGSVVRLIGDQVIVPGSLSASSLVVHDGTGNLLVNGDFLHGDLRGWASVSGGLSVAARGSSGSSAVQNALTPFILSAPNNGAQAQGYAIQNFPVSPGELFSLTADVATGGASPRDTRWQFRFRFDDVDGNQVGNIIIRNIDHSTVSWSGYTVDDVEVPEGAASLRQVLVRRVAGGTGESYITNIVLRRKQSAATLIEPRSIFTEHLFVEWLQGNRVQAEFIDVNSRLLIQRGGYLSHNKVTADSDEADGIYFGRDGSGGFGLSASRVKDGRFEMIKMTEKDGLQIINPQFFYGVSFGGQETNAVLFTSNVTRQPIPPDWSQVTIQVVGGGGCTTSAGAQTVAQIYDGSTLRQVITAAGGAQSRSTYSAYGTQPSEWVPDGFYGSGGAGATGEVYQKGPGKDDRYEWRTLYDASGYPGEVETLTIDLSSYSNPRITVTIGAGAITTPLTETSTRHIFTNRENGINGAVGIYEGTEITPSFPEGQAGAKAASVVPVAPTQMGAHSGTSLPDLGAGIWTVWGAGSISGDAGGAMATNNGATMICSRTPTKLTSFSGQYEFRKLGVLG